MRIYWSSPGFIGVQVTTKNMLNLFGMGLVKKSKDFFFQIVMTDDLLLLLDFFVGQYIHKYVVKTLRRQKGTATNTKLQFLKNAYLGSPI